MSIQDNFGDTRITDWHRIRAVYTAILVTRGMGLNTAEVKEMLEALGLDKVTIKEIEHWEFLEEIRRKRVV